MIDTVDRDLRVCFLGDSFVAGVGDPGHLGWVGRVAADVALTAYNLGIRRETSGDVLRRWRDECAPRLPLGADNQVVVSFGVNDTTVEDGAVRVAPAESVRNLGTLLDEVGAAGWAVLVVGPPPVADAEQNARIRFVSVAFDEVCEGGGIAYVPIVDALSSDPVWTAEVAAGDGAHPAARASVRIAATPHGPHRSLDGSGLWRGALPGRARRRPAYADAYRSTPTMCATAVHGSSRT